jgi:hypothetical protein
MTTRLRLLPVAALFAAGASCAMPIDEPDWRDQLVPESPCYRVNLLDGLDESSTVELRDTWACIDNGHQLDAYDPVIDSLEGASRDGVPAGVELARLVNHLPSAGVDPWGLVGVVADGLRSDDIPSDHLLDIALELTYGAPAQHARDGTVDLDDPDALAGGLLVPLGPVATEIADAALDDNLSGVRWAGEVLGHTETKRWLKTFGALAASDRAEIAEPMRALLPDLGEAIRDSRDASNDIAVAASGDSLHDLSRVMLTSRDPLIEQIAPDAGGILTDTQVQSKLPVKLVDWSRRGHLQRVPAELKWLASVDVYGGALTRAEPSALQGLITLLHDTNRPMRCSFDLWVTDLEIDLGNLAVTILNLLAGMNPDLLSGGVGLLSSILGWDLSQSLLQDIADSGVCPALNQNVVINLRTLDVLSDPRAYDLLVITTEGLGTLKTADSAHIQRVADLLTTVEDGGGSAPIAELVRDLGGSDLVADVVDLVPVLADPMAHGVDIGDETPADLEAGLALTATLFEPDADRKTSWEHVAPLIQPALQRDEAWDVVGRAGVLLRADGNRTADALTLVPPLLEVDPDLLVVDNLALLLQQPEVVGPLLRVADTDGVVEAALATRPKSEQPVPLAFTSQLIVDGTVDDVLGLVHTVLDALDGYSSK